MNKKKNLWEQIAPYLYIIPMGLVLIAFYYGSVAILEVLSFSRYNILTPPSFNGISNYTRLFADPKFIKAVRNTFKLAIMIMPFQMVVSLIISVFLVANRDRFLGKIANFAIFVPVLCSNAVIAVIWRELLNGHFPIVEKFFGWFGVDPSTLIGSAKTALPVVAMVVIWKSIGYYTVLYTSGLMGISTNYYEAAKIDGANSWEIFWRITLPLLKPTIILCLFMSVTSSLQCYDMIMNLTGGGPNNASTTLVVYAYSLCFGSSNAGYAMAISNVLFGIVLVAVLLQSGMLRREASEI